MSAERPLRRLLLGAVPLAAAALWLAAPEDRLAAAEPRVLVVEIDTVGIQPRYFPKSILFGNAMVSLTTIFEPVGIRVVPNVHESFPGGGPGHVYQDKELDQLRIKAENQRPADPSVWYMHVLVAPGEGKKVLGELPDAKRRSRLTVFVRPGDSDADLLRTTAHEVGHALNLFHTDGDDPTGCCIGGGPPGEGRSLMNQTACLWHQWSFALSGKERAHLLTHPVDGVAPSGPWEFGRCQAGHVKGC